MLKPKKRKILFKSKYITVGTFEDWEFADRNGNPGIVSILAVTDENKIILVEQFRAPVQKNVIEMPAGLSGDIPGQENEELAEAAKRELLEETGYIANSMEFIAEGPPSPGILTEIVTFFRATKMKKVAKGGGIGPEQITVHEIKLENVEDWLTTCSGKGILVDPKVYLGLYFAKLKKFSNSND